MLKIKIRNWRLRSETNLCLLTDLYIHKIIYAVQISFWMVKSRSDILVPNLYIRNFEFDLRIWISGIQKFKIIKDKINISCECVECRSELIWYREIIRMWEFLLALLYFSCCTTTLFEISKLLFHSFTWFKNIDSVRKSIFGIEVFWAM